MSPEPKRPRGPLRPLELATAAVMATVATVLTVAGYFLPHLGALASMAVVPLGVVAHRHRLRALCQSTFAASVVCFLVAGTGAVSTLIGCSAIGGLIGTAKRRGWGPLVVIAGVAVIGPVLASFSIGLLALLSSLRRLVLKQIVNTWHGARRFIDAAGSSLHAAGSSLSRAGVKVHLGFSVPHKGDRLTSIDRLVQSGVRHWWAAVGIAVVVGIAWLALLGWVFMGAVLERLRWVRGQDRLELGDEGDDRPAPLPVQLVDVSYRYLGTDRDALAGVTASIGEREIVAVVGDNGSGKSTLTRLLAGRPPTSGRVDRPGPAGLGRREGTAVVLQHPESQVLGVRVADDVVWGLPDATGVDVAGLLRRVGLEGMEDRETSGLSGGELQRLAVAAALARSPRLLISDESTAMVDEAGRRALVDLLCDLPGRDGTSVVHVTHRPEEAQRADRTYRLQRGRLADPEVAPAAERTARDADDGAAVTPGTRSPLVVAGISHTYGLGTPWAKSALCDVDLTVQPGEGVLVVGDNGSGKSTLAWIMTGLLRPTRGECLLGDRPVREQIGSVGLAFQHARLQLQRATVKDDIRAAGAADDTEVAAALSAVGMDAATMGDRRIDELSGGEQRRVALAGLLSRLPGVLVLDEPLAGLDRPSHDGLIELLQGLRRRRGLTLIVISHDMGGMERICDRVVRLEAGRIVEERALAGVGG